MSVGSIRNVLIVGGGSAGWLAACHLAKKLASNTPAGVQVRLIESADIPTIGVGEGTVPAIRQSLQYLGISESEFIRECDVTFKQSIKFVDWLKPAGQTQQAAYHHLFDYPDLATLDLTPYWLQGQFGDMPYADVVAMQGHLCEAGFGPKSMQHAEYQGLTNYAYHLDAAKFSALLTRHATEKLGVQRLVGTVTAVRLGADGQISGLQTDQLGELTADLYIDCTGFQALLIGDALQVPFIDKQDVLFVDSAIAVQVPYAEPEQAIPGYTIATAQEAGWIWDIGLTNRRGTGYVYSSAHSDADTAEQVLRVYLKGAADHLTLRHLKMRVGYRERFWQGNCIALGLAQGFVEPLEATGLLVYDATARMLAECFPNQHSAIPALAERFNQRVRLTWDRVIDFIKLHYYLSQRDDTAFWRENRNAASCPQSLLDNLAIWQQQLPNAYDFHSKLEIFNLENYLYVLYGMQFKTNLTDQAYRFPQQQRAQQLAAYYRQQALAYQSKLLPHRELLRRIQQYGLAKI